MIRILTADSAEAITITVDGQLTGDTVDAVETCGHEAIADGRPVHLFLRDVSTIDESGRELLCRLAESGVRLSAAGIYSSYVVAGIESRRTVTAAQVRSARAQHNGKRKAV